jgi:iron complex outermembrane receptor protein
LLWDQRVSFNAAAFYYDFKDKQEQVHTGVSFIVSNAGETSNYGMEFEVLAHLAEGLELQASLGILDAIYDKFPNGGGPGVDFDGNELAGAPNYTGSVNLQYVRPIGPFELLLRGEVDFRDGFYTEPANNPALELDSATFVNARIGLRSPERTWEVYLFGQNINDEDVLGGGVSTVFNTTRVINRGAVYGAELRVNL